MSSKSALNVALILVGCALAGVASAHTTIRESTPANGAALTTSPAVIDITFEHAAQLTSVILVSPGHADRKLSFEPIGSSLEFKLATPNLAPGRNELHWKGLSSDGHVIEGTLVYTIGPAAATKKP
jgi:methionine-rich copper-binding protein CopC